MRTKAQISNIADGIYTNLMGLLKSQAESDKARIEEAIKGSDDLKMEVMTSVIESIELATKAASFDGVTLPAYISRLVFTETDKAEITVKTKLKSSYSYKKCSEVKLTETFIMDAGKVYIDALYDMFYIEEAIANVNVLNAEIDKIIKENNITPSFKFAIDPNKSSFILSIDDNEVVFNASVSDSHNIAKLPLFVNDDSEYDKLVRDKYIESFVNTMSAIQTTPQLVKAKLPVVNEVTGVSTKKRVSKLIRETYHRQAKNLDVVKKGGYGYFLETVAINGVDTEVCSLVKKDADGTLSVVLKPFNSSTLEVVDFDVLSTLK